MSIEPAQPPEALAEAPFDDARADLILRSSDSVHFRVFKIILSLASPIFADMFSIPSPASPQSLDEIQVVPLSEHSKTLDVALRHLYPVRSPDAITLHDASILAEFADKYQVDGLERFITHYLADNVEQDPVGVYTIAAKYGYKDIGAKAAQSCQRLPFSRLQSPYIRCATVELHAELLRYHTACGEAASAVTSKRGWFSSLGSNLNLNMDSKTARRNSPCSCVMQDFIGVIPNPSPISINGWTQPVTERYGPKCLWNYLYRSALVLAHHPTAEAVNAEDFILKTYDCTSCPSETRRQMLELGIVLGREVKKAVERVSHMSLRPLSHVCDVH
jgi:BTB/POZ domain